jgi:hypothetical protein
MTNEAVKTEQVIEGAPEKKEFGVGSSKFTLTELIIFLGLEGKSQEIIYEEISMHIRKGSVKPLNKLTKQEKLLLSVQQGLANRAHLSTLFKEEQDAVVATRNKNNTERLKYDDVKFTVAGRLQMENVRSFLQNKAIPASVAQDVDTMEYIFTISEATDAELNALDKYLKGQEISIKMKSVGGKIASGTSILLKGTLAVTGGVIAGTTKVAIDVVGKTTEAVTGIGAAGIVRTKDAYLSAKKNLSESKEAMEAKELLSSGWDAMKRKFGGGKSSRFF